MPGGTKEDVDELGVVAFVLASPGGAREEDETELDEAEEGEELDAVRAAANRSKAGERLEIVAATVVD